MKKITAIMLVFILALAFAGCKDNSKDATINELVSVSPEEAQELYEDMTDLASKGKYEEAVKNYVSGAAGADDEELLNWYFYAMAMKEYEEHGCIGYPVTIMQYNTDEDFEPAQNAVSELSLKGREFSGIYQFNGTYLYILDGKVAFSVGEKLTGTVFTSYELAYKNGKFFIMLRNNDGTHKKAYDLDYNQGILSLVAADGNADDLYAGSFIRLPGEYPEIIY